jgi:hypothetical protein
MNKVLRFVTSHFCDRDTNKTWSFTVAPDGLYYCGHVWIDLGLIIKNLVNRHGKPKKPTKEGLFESRLPQFQQSAGATPLLSLCLFQYLYTFP